MAKAPPLRRESCSNAWLQPASFGGAAADMMNNDASKQTNKQTSQKATKTKQNKKKHASKQTNNIKSNKPSKQASTHASKQASKQTRPIQTKPNQTKHTNERKSTQHVDTNTRTHTKTSHTQVHTHTHTHTHTPVHKYTHIHTSHTRAHSHGHGASRSVCLGLARWARLFTTAIRCVRTRTLLRCPGDAKSEIGSLNFSAGKCTFLLERGFVHFHVRWWECTMCRDTCRKTTCSSWKGERSARPCFAPWPNLCMRMGWHCFPGCLADACNQQAGP